MGGSAERESERERESKREEFPPSPYPSLEE
jgi:hypothetical protein